MVESWGRCKRIIELRTGNGLIIGGKWRMVSVIPAFSL
jgi:hypothetical protein